MAIMPETLVGRVTSSGDESSSMDPKSFSSFSISSSLVTGIGWPSCWDSWVRRCLRLLIRCQLKGARCGDTYWARLSDLENALLQ